MLLRVNSGSDKLKCARNYKKCGKVCLWHSSRFPQDSLNAHNNQNKKRLKKKSGLSTSEFHREIQQCEERKKNKVGAHLDQTERQSCRREESKKQREKWQVL